MKREADDNLGSFVDYSNDIVLVGSDDLSGALSQFASDHKWKLILAGVAIAAIGGTVVYYKARPHYKIMKEAAIEVSEKYRRRAESGNR